MIANGQNVLKKLHYLPLGKVCAISLVYGGITDAIAIWDKFADHFCNNLFHQLRDWPNIPKDLTNPNHDYGLYLLSELLKESGKTLEQCGLSLPNHTW